MPDHHLPDDVLLAYAGGVASEPHALLCAVHLTLCETCRTELAFLDEIGGVLLEAKPPVVEGAAPRAAERAFVPPDDDLPLPEGAETWPRPLHPYVRGLRWRWHSPGVRVLNTRLFLDEVPVRIYRLAPGQRVPLHTHRGTELSFVLSGGFVDLGEHFGRGDIACRDADTAHDVVVDPDGECVTLAINEHPLVPLTWGGKIYAALFGA
jgi:putative transcriptional regulator